MTTHMQDLSAALSGLVAKIAPSIPDPTELRSMVRRATARSRHSTATGGRHHG